VVRRAAEDAAELAGQRDHQLGERRVAVADVVVDERALDRRGRVDRAGVEQHVAGVVLGVEERGDLVLDLDRAARVPRPLRRQRDDAAGLHEREQAVLDRRVRQRRERLEDRAADQRVAGEHAVIVVEILADRDDGLEVGVVLARELHARLGATRDVGNADVRRDRDRGVDRGVRAELREQAQRLGIERTLAADDQAALGVLDERARDEQRRAREVLPRQVREHADVEARQRVELQAIPQRFGVLAVDHGDLADADRGESFQRLTHAHHRCRRESVPGLQNQSRREHDGVRDHAARVCNKYTARRFSHLRRNASAIHRFVTVV